MALAALLVGSSVAFHAPLLAVPRSARAPIVPAAATAAARAANDAQRAAAQRDAAQRERRKARAARRHERARRKRVDVALEVRTRGAVGAAAAPLGGRTPAALRAARAQHFFGARLARVPAALLQRRRGPLATFGRRRGGQ